MAAPVNSLPVCHSTSFGESERPRGRMVSSGGLSKNISKIAGSSLTLALFIIGFIGAAGAITGGAMGGCTIAFSLSLALLGSITALKLLQNPARLLSLLVAIAAFTALMVLLGSLTAAGVISPVAMGWVIITPLVGMLGLACCIFCCAIPLLGGTVLGIHLNDN